jgi:hypothetical protein
MFDVDYATLSFTSSHKQLTSLLLEVTGNRDLVFGEILHFFHILSALYPHPQIYSAFPAPNNASVFHVLSVDSS